MRTLAAAAVLVASVPAFAWGPEGHSLVARIAWEQMTPEARQRVAAILAPGQTMPSIASWADEIRRTRRETAPWHFIDIPIDHRHRNMDHECANGDCVIAAIARFRVVLKDPAASEVQRREALMFIVHFVGDMHQPLHSSDHDDRGGNSVQVVFHGRPTNLHTLWDSAMLGRLGTEDQIFPELSRESQRRAHKWDKGSVEDWAEQSHRSAQKMLYGKLPKTADKTPVPISDEYERAADELIKLQLEKAGARLAKVLNSDLK